MFDTEISYVFSVHKGSFSRNMYHNILYSIIWHLFSGELPLIETCRNAQRYEQIRKDLYILFV